MSQFAKTLVLVCYKHQRYKVGSKNEWHEFGDGYATKAMPIKIAEAACDQCRKEPAAALLEPVER